MAFVESAEHQQERMARSGDAFPELSVSTPDSVYKVNQSGLRTPFGDAAESALVDSYAEQQAAQPRPPASGGVFGGLNGYDPNTPDSAPNAIPWNAQPEDPYSMEAMKRPYTSPDSSYYQASASPWDTLKNLGGVFNPLSQDSVFGTFAPDANPVVQELARPSNYIGGVGGLRGAARGAVTAVGARLASEGAGAALEGAPEPVRIAGQVGAGLIGGVLAHQSPRLIRAADAALNPADLRGAAPEAFQHADGRTPYYGWAANDGTTLPPVAEGYTRLYRGEPHAPDVLNGRNDGPGIWSTGLGEDTTGRWFTQHVGKAERYAGKDTTDYIGGKTTVTPADPHVYVVDVPTSELPSYRPGAASGSDSMWARTAADEYVLPADVANGRRANAPGQLPTPLRSPSLSGGADVPPGTEIAPAAALEKSRDAVTALMDSIKSAKPLQDINAEKLSQFRSRQAGGFAESVGEGESGFGRGLAAMRGTAERVGFEPLRDVIGQSGVDELFTRLGGANLRPFEHASAGSALRNIMDGVVPVPSELAQLEKAYPGLTKALREAKIVSGPSLGEYASDLASIPQSLKSAFDLSGFRQTATASYGHPIMAGKAFAQSLKAAASEGNFEAIQQDLNGRWYAPMRADAGVAVASGEQGLSRGEGTIISTIVNKIPGYRPSQRAYATMLNVMRDGLFQNMVEGWGGDVKAIPADELRRWGRMINITTGRGDVSELALLGHELPVSGITENKVAGIPLFWAPRLMLSRVQMPFEMLSSSPQVRKEVARQLVAFVGVNSMILGMGKAAGMWDVEGDPRSSDFGQIHVGNQRIDPWAGFRPIVNLVSRIKSGEVKSTMAGGTYTKDRLAVAEDFLRQKFSPITSTAANVLTGKDAIGQPVTPGKVAADLVTPLFLKDVYEATKIDGPGAGGRALLGGLGLGINTYEPTKGSSGYPTLDGGKSAGYPKLNATTQGAYPRLGR